MGIAAYARVTAAMRRQIDADAPTATRIVLSRTEQPATPALSRAKVRQVMRRAVANIDPDGGPTALAEYAAGICSCNQGGGPLDDETHWIWELALQVWEREHGEVA